MHPYRVLTVLSLDDGTHIHPGSVISLPEASAATLLAVGAIAPISDVPPADSVAATAKPAKIPTKE